MNNKEIDDYILNMIGTKENLHYVKTDPIYHALFKLLQDTVKVNFELRENKKEKFYSDRVTCNKCQLRITGIDYTKPELITLDEWKLIKKDDKIELKGTIK